jgi:AcrR family transcriptional regulator
MPGAKADEAVRREQIRVAAYEIAIESGVRGITIRDVAERAGVSPGLVLFHYGSKEQLVLDVLAWVMETTTALHIGPEIAAVEKPGDRLLALLRQEMERISRERGRIRLFFEFWSAGLWDAEIGMRMQAELDRYREAFRPMAEAVLRADPKLFPGVTAAGLAAVVVSFIKGCAVQSLIEPDLEIREFIGAAEGLLAQLTRMNDAGSPSASETNAVFPS